MSDSYYQNFPRTDIYFTMMNISIYLSSESYNLLTLQKYVFSQNKHWELVYMYRMKFM